MFDLLFKNRFLIINEKDIQGLLTHLKNKGFFDNPEANRWVILDAGREELTNQEKPPPPFPPAEEEKQRLIAERESLLRAKAKFEAELETLPQIDPAEVEIALSELAKPWQMSNVGGYGVRHPMSWERRSVVERTWQPDMLRKLTEEQARLLRETLLKLNCRISIKNRAIFISGKLPLGVRAKEGAF